MINRTYAATPSIAVRVRYAALTHDGGVAHLIGWIRIVGTHRRAPDLTINLSHNFSCVSPLQIEAVRKS